MVGRPFRAKSQFPASVPPEAKDVWTGLLGSLLLSNISEVALMMLRVDPPKKARPGGEVRMVLVVVLMGVVVLLVVVVVVAVRMGKAVVGKTVVHTMVVVPRMKTSTGAGLSGRSQSSQRNKLLRQPQ